MIPTLRLGLAMGALALACTIASAQTPPRKPDAPATPRVEPPLVQETPQATPTQPRQPPPQFTPSEEISPDKPVSFPADI